MPADLAGLFFEAPMHLQSLYPVVALVVGLIVGLTGVGGGSLMTPTLVFLFKIPLGLAIGTDLVFASLTKIVGVAAHGGGGNGNLGILDPPGAGRFAAFLRKNSCGEQFETHAE